MPETLLPPTAPSLRDISFGAIVPDTQKAAEESRAALVRMSAAKNIDYLDMAGAAFDDTIPNKFMRALDRAGIPETPGFALDDQLLESLTEGVDPRLWMGFVGARSLDHAMALRAEYVQRTKNQETLSLAGYSGMAASIVAGVTDPAYILLGAATAGVSPLLGVTGRVSQLVGSGVLNGVAFGSVAATSRAGMLARVAALNAAGAGGVELAASQVDPAITGGDIARAVLSGVGMSIGGDLTAASGPLGRAAGVGSGAVVGQLLGEIGGAIGGENRSARQILEGAATQLLLSGGLAALHSGEAVGMRKVAEKIHKDVMFDMVKEQARAKGVPITEVLGPKGPEYFKEQMSADATAAARVVDAHVHSPELRAELDSLVGLTELKSNMVDGRYGPLDHNDLAEFNRLMKTPQWQPGDIPDLAIDPGKVVAIAMTERDVMFEVATQNKGRIKASLDEIEMPSNAFFRASAEQLSSLAPSGVRVINKNFGARLAPDGAIEVGNLFAKARSGERRAMIEQELIRPAAAMAIVNEIDRAKAPGERPVAWESLIEAKFGISPADAKVVVDDLRAQTGAAESRLSRVGRWADAKIAKVETDLSTNVLPRGRGAGGTIIFDEIAGRVQIAVLKAIKAGAETIEKIQQVIDDLLRPHMADLKPEEIRTLHQMGPQMLTEQEAYLAELAKATEAGEAPSPSAAGKREPNPVPPRQFGDLDTRNVANVPMSEFGTAMFEKGALRISPRFDMAGHVGQSPVGAVRDAGAKILPDPLPRGDQPRYTDSYSWADSTYGGIMGSFNGQIDSIYANYLRSSKSNKTKALRRDAFSEQVGSAVRRPAGKFTNDPDINRAADLIRQNFANLHGLAARHQVKGLDQFDARDTYLTRVGSRTKIDFALQNFGAKDVERVVADAILKGSEGIDIAVVNKMARAWVRNVGTRTTAMEDIFRMAGGSSTVAQIKERMMEALPELSVTEAEVLAKSLVVNQDEARTIKFAKRRMSMDETYTDEDLGLGIEDLLENNAETILDRYARRMVGEAALGDVYRTSPDTADGRKPESIVELRRVLEAKAAEQGLARDNPQLRSDLDKIEIGMRLTAGIPLQENTATVRALRSIRQLNVIRLLSSVQTGIQNFAEISGAIAEDFGVSAFQQFPALLETFKRAKDGQLSNETIRELAILTGAGEEMSVRRIRSGYTDEGHRTTKVEELISKGGRLAGMVSGITPGQTMLERFVGVMVMQRWMNIAKGGKRPGKARLAAMGINPESDMVNRISAEMVKHSKTETGGFGERLIRSNVEKWDADAAAAFRNAVQNETFRLVLRNNPASYAKWMTNETGKVVAQLRTFSFQSWTAKTLYAVKVRDAATASSLVLSSVGAAAAYVLRTGIDSIDKPASERDKFLRQRLSIEAIAKAGFSRAAYSSLLPMAVDTVAPVFGYDEPFSYARTSNIGNNVPTLDWLQNAWRAKSAVFGPMQSDYDFSQEDVKALRAALFIPRVMGVNGALNRFQQSLPKTSKKLFRSNP